MSEFLDYNPATGVIQKIEADDSSISIRSEQDVEPILDYTKVRREHAAPKGKVEEWALYAVIPEVVQLELYKKGINWFKPEATKDVLREINQNYPYLKCTTKHHE